MPQKVGMIELNMSPQEVGGPDSLHDAIIGFIKREKRGLDIAVQELDSLGTAQAIIEARKRGVTVRLSEPGPVVRSVEAI